MAEDPYAFVERLSGKLTAEDTVVCDAGSSYYVCHQGLKLPEGCRLITDLAQGGMGAAVPMAIGSAFAKEDGKVYVVTGDGSAYFQLASMMQAKSIPCIEVYVLWNEGYKSIRDSQDRYCDGRRMGDPSLGIWALAALSEVVMCTEYEIVKPERRKVGNAGSVDCDVPRRREVPKSNRGLLEGTGDRAGRDERRPEDV